MAEDERLAFSARYEPCVRLPETARNGGITEEAGVEPTEDACAPSNGFEARAPHRERYSSEAQNAAVLPAIKGASGVVS